MNTQERDYRTVANARLIAQVAEYYNGTQRDLQFYRDLTFPKLESLASEHLKHWQQELHNLIFDGMNCRERSLR